VYYGGCGNGEFRYVPLTMAKLCSASSFTRALHYTTLNFTYVEDQQIFHNVKIKLDTFDKAAFENFKVSPLLPQACEALAVESVSAEK